MMNLNFPLRWVDWIKECISTAKANVLVNGCSSGEFSLERGIRQGDPLLPFLFLVSAKGLNLLAKRAVKRGMLKVAELGKNKVCISHIQYADDTLFIGGRGRENAKAIEKL